MQFDKESEQVECWLLETHEGRVLASMMYINSWINAWTHRKFAQPTTITSAITSARGILFFGSRCQAGALLADLLRSI